PLSHPSGSVVLSHRAEGLEGSVGRRPLRGGGADVVQCSSVCHPLYKEGAAPVLGLPSVPLVPCRLYLVWWYLWPVSAGAGGDGSPVGGGSRRNDDVPLSVQRAVCGHAPQGHSTVLGGWGVGGRLSA